MARVGSRPVPVAEGRPVSPRAVVGAALAALAFALWFILWCLGICYPIN